MAFGVPGPGVWEVLGSGVGVEVGEMPAPASHSFNHAVRTISRITDIRAVANFWIMKNG